MTTISPDRKYPDRGERSIRPSWSGNPGYLGAEHRAIFDSTRDLPGWQEEGDSYKLYEMGYFAGDVILEVGVYGGRSAVVELRGALSNPARVRRPQFFGIDVEASAIARSHKTLSDAGLDEYAILYQGDLRSFMTDFCIRPTMVFVDGDHKYQGVRGDLDALSEALSPGVAVLCHDYLNPENQTGEYGVRRSVEEWEASGYDEFIGAFGCAALLVTSSRCSGPRVGLTDERFAERRIALLVAAGIVPDPQLLAHRTQIGALEHQLEASEADRAARLNVIYDLLRRVETLTAAAARVRELEAVRDAQQLSIENLQARVEILLTTRSALRRLGAASARALGVYGLLKRLF